MQITGSILQPALTIKATSLGAVMQFASIPNASTGSFTGSVGNMWFNTSTNQLQYTWQSGSVIGAGVWTSGTAMINARGLLGSSGTQNATLGFNGWVPGFISCTELFNGSTWTTVSGMIASRYGLKGAGSSTSTVGFGGNCGPTVGTTENYNGSSWATGNAMITGRAHMAAAGVQNSALAVGGYNAPTGNTQGCVELFNGSTWAAGPANIVPRDSFSGAGALNTDSIIFGGEQISAFTPTANVCTCTEKYNGTSWSSGGSLITGRVNSGASSGISTSALVIGGYLAPARLTCTEYYNGSVWSSTTALIIGRNGLGAAGSNTATVAFGGFAATPSISCTELYNAPTIALICTRSL